MKLITCIILQLTLGLAVLADTPPPGTVKAKMYSGDGNTAVNVTGGSMNVNVTGGSGLTTSVNQGAAGVAAWLVDGSAHTQPVSGTFWQATQPVSGTLTCNAGTGTLAVSGPLTDAQLRATPVPISGTITASNSANGATGSAVPSQATQIGGSDGTNLRAVKVSSSGVVSVDGSASTQPISAASLPLPSGAATSALQSTINTTLGSPFQAGGSIGNSSFGISGTLPAYAATPTFNLGTLNGAATAANQATEITALGTINTTLGLPFQAGGSIGNSSFGISGTLPAYASTPTFNLGTLNGAATAANQATEITALGTINTTLGTPMQSSGGTVTVTQATGTNLHTVVDSSALPSGAATSALQTTGNTALTTINTTLGTPMQTTGGTVALVAGSAIVGKVSIDQTTPGTTNGVQVNAALPAGSNVIGHVIADSGSTTAVTQATAASLNATVVTTGGVAVAKDSSLTTINSTLGSPFQAGGSIGNTTFASTQSGTWNVNATPVVPTAVTVKQAAITIGTSAVRLTTDGSAPSSTRVLLVAQLLSSSTANCYFGSSSVTSTSTTRGVQMFAGQAFSFNKDAGDYYAICDASSQTFLITEQE